MSALYVPVSRRLSLSLCRSVRYLQQIVGTKAAVEMVTPLVRNILSSFSLLSFRIVRIAST